MTRMHARTQARTYVHRSLKKGAVTPFSGDVANVFYLLPSAVPPILHTPLLCHLCDTPSIGARVVFIESRERCAETLPIVVHL